MNLSALATPRRQHPVAALTFVLRTIREMLVPLVIFFFLGRGGESPLFTWWGFSLLAVTLLLIGLASWMRFTWRVEENELRIEQGLFVRKKKYVPRERIQAIDISSGPLQRLFGLVQLQVRTAGESGPEAGITALAVEDARAIQQALESSDSSRSAPNESVLPEQAAVWRLSRKRLMLAASTAGSFGVALSIIGTLMAQINQVVDENTLIEFIERTAGGIGTELWVSLVIVAIILAWLLSVFGTLLRFSGFTLTRNSRELIIQRGLFEKKQITIPFHRIQAVRIVEGVLRQPFGYAMIYVENAGFGDEAGKTTVLAPLLHRSEAETFFSEMLPFFKRTSPKEHPPGRAFMRYQIKTGVPVIIATLLLAWLFSLIWLPLIVLPAGALLAWLRYRDAAAGFDGDWACMRFRNLARTTAYMQRQRIQSFSVQSNWFQRRKKLVSLVSVVASGRSGTTFSADHYDQQSTDNWRGWFSQLK